MQLSMLVLPAPFGPINAWMVPASTSKLTLRSAFTPPNRSTTLSTASCAIGQFQEAPGLYPSQHWLGERMGDCPLAEQLRPAAQAQRVELAGAGLGTRKLNWTTPPPICGSTLRVLPVLSLRSIAIIGRFEASTEKRKCLNPRSPAADSNRSMSKRPSPLCCMASTTVTAASASVGGLESRTNLPTPTPR